MKTVNYRNFKENIVVLSIQNNTLCSEYTDLIRKM